MITSAACRATVNGTKQIFKVHRHPDFFLWMKQIGCEYDKDTVKQGFIDWDFALKKERFVSREEAAKIAFECGQIPYKKEELFTEDLW